MTFNIILGFLLPWIFGIYLYLKDRNILLVMAPFGAVFALLYNSIGFHIPFWKLHPFSYGRLALLPFDLGLYAVLASYLIFFIRKYKMNNYKIIFLFSILTTLGEGIALLLGNVVYYNNWNIAWAFVSYATPYLA